TPRARRAGRCRAKCRGRSRPGWSRTGQELAERHDVGIAAFAQPFSPFDEFRPEVTEMRDRSAERRKAQFEEGGENLGDGACGSFRHANQLQCRLKIPVTGNVTKRLGRAFARKSTLMASAADQSARRPEDEITQGQSSHI